MTGNDIHITKIWLNDEFVNFTAFKSLQKAQFCIFCS
jgi:hypothetical protein